MLSFTTPFRTLSIIALFGYRRLEIWWGVTGGSLDFVAAHMDDMLCGGTRANVNLLKSFLRDKFDVRDLGPVSVFIGLRITVSMIRERRMMVLKRSLVLP